MGKLYYGVKPSEHIVIKETTQYIHIHEHRVEVKVEPAGLRMLQTEVTNDRKDQHAEAVADLQNQLHHHKQQWAHHKRIVSELVERMQQPELSEVDNGALLTRLKDQNVIIRTHSKHIESLEKQIQVDVCYQEHTTGLSVLLSEGRLHHPSFLPIAVCWTPFGMDIELEGIAMTVVTHNQFDKISSRSLLGESECKWSSTLIVSDAEEFDLKQAEYLSAAESDCSYGQCLLGAWYYSWGIMNREKAAELFTLSAEQGNSWGQCLLGSCYMHHGDPASSFTTVALDKKRGIELYRISAEQGNGLARYRLAQCYLHGNGVEKNSAMARQYRVSADEYRIYQNLD